MAIHELQTYASHLFIDFYRKHLLRDLLVSSGYIYLSAFLELLDVQTAGRPNG